MSLISAVLLLAVAMMFTSDGIPVGNHSVDILAELKISKSHPAASVHRKMAVEEKLPDRSAEDQIDLQQPDEHQINPARSAVDPKLELSNSSAQLSEKVPEDICAFVNTCNFGICVPKSDYPGFNCQCYPGYMGINCNERYEGFVVFIVIIFVILPGILALIHFWPESCQRPKITSASTNGVKSGKTATTTSLTVECETEITLKTSSVVTPNSSESTVTETSSTEMIRG